MTRADTRSWSCDSFVILPGATADGSMLLGKNSDRPVNESQPLRYVPARSGSRADRLRLAYLETSGRRWVAAQVRGSSWSVSNQATIRTDWDRASGDLAEHARNAGWWRDDAGRFDFAAAANAAHGAGYRPCRFLPHRPAWPGMARRSCFPPAGRG